MKDCGKVLTDYIDKNVQNGSECLDFKELMARFTTNIISSIGFGIENDCINDPNHIFREKGTKIFYGSLSRKIRNFLLFFTPSLMKTLKIRFVDRDVEEFMKSIVNQTIEHREKNNVQRNDFMQLLIQLKNEGCVSAENDENEDNTNGNSNKLDAQQKLTMNEITAQAFVFFAAGFETSSSTSSYCLFELAKNHKVQQKLYDEIVRVLEEEGELNYSAVNNMKYLDCCIDETLRKYPIVPLFRECNENFQIPGSDLVIEKGSSIFLSTFGMHRDPNIFDDPLEFRPERFLNSPQGNGKGKGVIYSPFGTGPRNCIGERLGKLQTKLGIALLISKYRFELRDSSMYSKELKFRVDSVTLNAEGAIDLKVFNR
jgi:cytochrome P450 family 6